MFPSCRICETATEHVFWSLWCTFCYWHGFPSKPSFIFQVKIQSFHTVCTVTADLRDQTVAKLKKEEKKRRPILISG